MKRRISRNVNGHAAQAGRPNGHAPDLSSSRAPIVAAAAEETPRDVANGRGGVSIPRDLAASVDACEATVAGAANPSAACPGRQACAGAAPPRPPDPLAAPDEPAPEEELAQDAPGFVEDMHRLVNLYAVGKRFLTSTDDKIAQRAWEKMLELRYGKGAAAAAPPEEPPRIDFGDMFKPDPQ